MAPMRFEKWQALGNDYLIVERDELPFELTPARMRRLCEGHFGVFADGVLLLSPPADPAHVADLRIFNPDGSEAELSGNGAREAIMYLRRRGWTDQDELRDPHRRRRRSARGSPAPTRARVDMGPREPALPGLPRRRRGRPGRGRSAGDRIWRFQHVSIGNPQCAIHVATRRAGGARPPAIGPAIEARRAVPQPHERLLVHRARAGPPGASARGSSSAAWGRRCRRAPAPAGAAVAHDLAIERPRARASVTVLLDGGELEVEVGEDLRVNLTGWARPVFEGRLSDDFAKELHETE